MKNTVQIGVDIRIVACVLGLERRGNASMAVMSFAEARQKRTGVLVGVGCWDGTIIDEIDEKGIIIPI